MMLKQRVRVDGPTSTAPTGMIVDGWGGKRFQTLRVRTLRRTAGELLNHVDGAIEFVLYLRMGDVDRQRSFMLGAQEEITLDVSQNSDASLELKASDLQGYDVLVMLDEAPPVGHVDATARWYDRRTGIGDFPVPAGAVSVGLSAVDAGWRWLGRSVEAAALMVIVEPATFIGGSVKGSGYRTTVAPLDLAWTVAF